MKKFNSKIAAAKVAAAGNKARKIKDLYSIVFYGPLTIDLYGLPGAGWYIVNQETKKIL